MRYILLFLFGLITNVTYAQKNADQWVDSVYQSLTPDERIAQLMAVRLTSLDGGKVTYYDQKVLEWVKKYNVGGVLIFQGSPQWQAKTINTLQAAAKTPIMFSIDGEWGVGMRIIDSVRSLPKQMMLGAMNNQQLVYEYGKLVANQCKRLGIHVNYAPVVDVNNNAANPVINDRSFGENKLKVAKYGVAYMKGMQDNGVMACAKHFPGHGDVSVDSHYDLPIINKSLQELDTLELFPFKELFKAGVGSVMVAHLYIPSIDKTANRATSISPKAIQGLLRDDLKYQGLTFTDALEMKGVQKFFPGGQAAVEAIIAGNDVLCLPLDVPETIQTIKKAIEQKKLSWSDIELHCKKVLKAKYEYVLPNLKKIELNNLTEDLNKGVNEMITAVGREAITLIKANHQDFFPLVPGGKIAYVGVGTKETNAFGLLLEGNLQTDNYYISYQASTNEITSLLQILKKYDKVIVGIHNTTRIAKTNYGITPASIDLVQKIDRQNKTIVFHFANAYGAKYWCELNNVVIAYEDNEMIHSVAVESLSGKNNYNGTLPVTIHPNFPYGSGITTLQKKK